MESPSFCGQACHTPMHPQFPAWQGAVRIRGVACVDCHIGDGAGGVRAREAGRRAAARRWSRPIPIRGRFRPAPRCLPAPRRRRAEAVTSPDASVGDRIRVIREYADDEANTETMTVLQMHVSVTKSSAARDSLARRSRPSASSTWRRMRSGRRFRTSSDRRERPGQGVRRDGCDGPDAIRAAEPPHDGLHRLPQHGRPSDRADARAGRRSGHRRRDGEPRAAVCAARRRPPREGDVPQPGSRRARHRRRTARLLSRRGAAPSTSRRWRRPSARCRNSIAGTCFPR